MFTLPLSAKYDGRRISASETAWAGLLTVAVAVLVIRGNPAPGHREPDLAVWLVCLGIGAVILLAFFVYALEQTAALRALVLGSITGAIMGYVAVLSKAVVDIFRDAGVPTLLASWELWGLIAFRWRGHGSTAGLVQRGRAKELAARDDGGRTAGGLRTWVHRAG